MSGFNAGRVAKATSWLVVAQVLILLLKLALIPIMARLLDPADFGIVSACLAITAAVTLIGGGGGWAAALLVFEKDDFSAWRSAYTVTLCLACGLTTLSYFYADTTAEWMGLPEAAKFLAVFSLLFPPIIAAEFLSIYLLHTKRYSTDARISVVSEALAAAIAFTAAQYGAGAWALVLQQATSILCRFTCYIIITKIYPTLSIQFKLIFQMTPYAAKSAMVEGVNFFGVQYPNILIANALGATAAGFYGVSNRLASLPTDIVMQSTARILVPTIAAIKEQSEKNKALIWSGTANSIVLAPMLLGAAALSQPLCELALSVKFADAGPIFAFLCIGKALVTPCAGHYAFLKATNRTGVLLVLMAIRSSLMVAGTIMGIQHGGLVGAAAGFALANIPVVIIYSAVVLRESKMSLREQMRPVLITFGAAICMAVAVFNLDSYLASTGWWTVTRLMSGVVAGAFLYVLFVFVFFS